MPKNIITFALTFFICSSQLIAEAFTDEELKNMSLYELETLKKNQIQKSQKKLLKTLLKDQKKEIESCELLVESYYAMPYEDFVNEQKHIKSKTQKKLYKKITKTRKKYEQLKNENTPKFTFNIDEFSKEANFRTSFEHPVILSKGQCPNLKGAFTRLDYSNQSFLRGSILSANSTFLQIYFRYITSEKAIKQYYGIKKAILKSTGDIKKVTPIDLDYSVGEYSTLYTMDFGISISFAELENLAGKNTKEEFKIYSNAGDFILKVPSESFVTFYEGIKNNKMLADQFDLWI